MLPYARLLAAICLGCVALAGRADTPCSYCGTWRPFASVGVHYSSRDLLTVSEATLSLPGCSAGRIKGVEESIDSNVISNRAFPKPVRAILELQEAPKCSPPLQRAISGALMMLRVNPKSQPDSEELEVTFVLKEAKASDSLRSKGAAWYLVRASHNPCDEVSARGSLICGMIEQRKADEQLNAEWRRLLGVAGERQKQTLVQTQRSWLKAIAKACSEEEAESGGAPEWRKANEVLCVAVAYGKRAGEFSDLRTCYELRNHNCPELSAHP